MKILRLQQIVIEIAEEIADKAAEIEGAADAKVEGEAPGGFGIAVATIDGEVVSAGEAATQFPLQSISKVFALELALCALGDKVFERVGREPSGDPFNSIIDLEKTSGLPRNPFVNAGALAVVDILVEELSAKKQSEAVVEFVRRQAGLDSVELNDEVMASEHEGGDLNRAIMSFMRHHGNFHSPIDEVMEAYVKQCAFLIDCAGLARAGLFLAHTRRSPDDEKADAKAQRMRKVLALMMTCGHYDGSGDFALRVGLPAKSGVGGGILAVVPEIASVAVWSPNLDQHGNSMLGVRGLEMLAYRTGWSVFGPPIE
ncbi:glutaminase A [Sphingomonas qomolangmaensis]|uniref:Glutaminase n=1 Tax=Sphingomonas qomolangmaensis TaxID=2918765 RepID=A0ABY5L4W0_9SPHN|nr:glutaminase A [Sphingomonas qomolangmaensis]UUL81985.1 glutaminase A [Sphingomonas qomolangmaensis]